MTMTTARTVAASGKTGEVVQVSGPYRSGNNRDVVVFFVAGSKFTVCPSNGKATTWTMS